MNTVRIVGICLAKNEDLYIERVLTNVLDFCDEIIVLDNRSNDNTPAILSKLAKINKKISLHNIDNPLRSHTFVESYANTKTWVFKVDADEIYDPNGLTLLRNELLLGKYEKFWRIDGPSLHCISLDQKNKTATGYLSPPSKSVIVLYNFNAILSWKEPRNERLHGNNIVYKPGYDYYSLAHAGNTLQWEHSPLRCLHLAFIRRSSHDTNNISRPNPQEISSVIRKALTFLRNIRSGKIRFESRYKNTQYGKGTVSIKSLVPFFPN